MTERTADRPAGATPAGEPSAPDDPFPPRRTRRPARPETLRARDTEARRAVRSERRRGRRPGDRPPDEPGFEQARRLAARRRLTQRRRRRLLLLLVLITAALVGIDLVRGGQTQHEASHPAPTVRPEASVEPQPSVSPQVSTAPVGTVPQRGSGAFTSAGGGTPIRGTGGTLIRYQVKVERGSGQNPNAFAAAVDATLSDPRGWTHLHQWRFQRVTSGRIDATVLLATPATTNAICRAGGLDPGGYTSCRTDNKVVINLARWMLAVPAFAGDDATYREYVVNHEMGHQLGHGHVLCNGPGQPAPVMQQQTLGLQGCTPNAWPFVNGRYLTGAPTAGQ